MAEPGRKGCMRGCGRPSADLVLRMDEAWLGVGDMRPVLLWKKPPGPGEAVEEVSVCAGLAIPVA